MTRYADFYRRSIDDREAFWAEQASAIEWHRPFDQVCDYSRPPFARWFVGGFASVSLASRIDDARPTVIISADGGSRGGKVVAYKPLLDEAIRLAAHKPAKVLLVDRGLSPMERTPGRDEGYAPLRERHL